MDFKDLKYKWSILKVSLKYTSHIVFSVRVIRWHEQQAFSEEIKQLKNTHKQKEKQLNKKSGIYTLDPYLDKEGLLRVRGRLKKSNLHFSDIHPLLIGSKSKTTALIVKWCHQRTVHGGRGLTINEVRSNGYWVVKCNTVVRSLVGKCVKYHLLRGKLGQQKMADLQFIDLLMDHHLQIMELTCLVPFW